MICPHCIVLGIIGFFAMWPFIGPWFATMKAKLTRKLNETCEDEKCTHHEEDHDHSSGDEE